MAGNSSCARNKNSLFFLFAFKLEKILYIRKSSYHKICADDGNNSGDAKDFLKHIFNDTTKNAHNIHFILYKILIQFEMKLVKK